MTQWDDHFRKYYLVGNPFIWWGVAFSVVVYLMLLLNRWLRISFNRSSSISTSPIKLYSSSEQDMSMDDFSFAGQVCLGGWLLHYIPFYFMKRTLYLHHYLPALYFGILLFAFTIDRISSRLSSGGRGLVFFILIASTVGIFVYFYDFVYGFSGPRLPKYQEYRWFSTWNLYTDYELLTFQSATTGGSGGVGVSHSGP